jgi:DNA-nicking Smr family endonuclease
VDFGDILDRWERDQGRREGKGGREKKKDPGKKKDREEKQKGPGKPESPCRDANRLLSGWLDAHGVYDKDAEDPALNGAALSPAEKRRRALARRPDAVIDLHGLNRDQAWAALEEFFENSRRQGFHKLILIHGKGNHSPGGAVLRRTAREFIERCPFAGESGQGAAGGAGATWVLLK